MLPRLGEPAYEYSYAQGVEDGYLAPADIEQYDIHHDDREQAERVRGVYRADVKDKKLTDALTGQRVTAEVVAEKSEGGALEARLILPERVKAMSDHLFARLLATAEDDPLQKTIIFCASDHHADLVANALNNLYAARCRTQGHKRVPTYAFKCMSSVNGQALIPDFRGRQCSHFIATTKDLLTTGVNVPGACELEPKRTALAGRLAVCLLLLRPCLKSVIFPARQSWKHSFTFRRTRQRGGPRKRCGPNCNRHGRSTPRFRRCVL